MTKAVEAPVAEHETVTGTGPRPGEWVITVFMLAFFAAAYLIADDYPFRAALFPQMVSALGVLLSLIRIIGLVRDTVRGRRAPVPLPAPAPAPVADVEVPPASAAGAVPAADPRATAATAGTDAETQAAGTVDTTSELTIVDDELEDDASMEYVFASAGGRAWIEALSWIVAFFVAFFTLGAFLSVPLFALLYLRFSGKTSWLSAVIYAVVTGVLIYVAFRELVYIPLPTGYLPFMQF